MLATKVIIQIIIALGLINVWLIRFNKSTLYRGGDAQNLSDEFATYGLPNWSYYLVGFLKIAAALTLFVGIWWPQVVTPASALVTALMLGALAMHAKVKDPIKKYIPAFSVFTLSVLVLVL